MRAPPNCGSWPPSSTGDENGSTTAATETSTDAITDVEPTTDAPTTDAPTTDAGTGTTTQYVADAKEAADALTEFGNILSSTESIEKFKSKAPQAQEALDRFDAAIAKLDGYRMDDSTLEQQRAGLVEKGPAVSDVLRRFVDAAAANDEQATTDLLSEVMTALTEFSEAATNPTK
ncbi:MAG TPA: hypothetical protein PKE32_01865 [Miltoncostaeaceae bacterium]|nr:hypothetical protein [Miltoncostaeaceae bacterium]